MAKIDLVDEQIDAIVVQELCSIKRFLEQDIYNASIGNGWHHPDDVKKYPKDLKAVKRVLKMYTVGGKLKCEE